MTDVKLCRERNETNVEKKMFLSLCFVISHHDEIQGCMLRVMQTNSHELQFELIV